MDSDVSGWGEFPGLEEPQVDPGVTPSSVPPQPGDLRPVSAFQATTNQIMQMMRGAGRQGAHGSEKQCDC